MTAVIPVDQDAGRIAVLEEIEQRVLWLATAIIDTRTACDPTRRASRSAAIRRRRRR
jgi:hypothetical protein